MLRTIEFINKNFLTLSAVATAFGVAASIIFITGYLVVFDRNLIWVIEYQDVFKFALIASSLIAASLFFVGGMSDYIKIIQSKDKSKYIVISFIVLSIVIMSSILAYNRYIENDIYRMLYELVVMFLFLSILMLIFMLVDYWVQIRDGGKLTMGQNFAIGLFSVITILLMGFSYGLNIKSDKDNFKDLIVKDKSNSESVFGKIKIVIFLSHHFIFEHESKIYIIPATDVVRISSSKPSK
jgi:hypothetical protein